MAKNNKKYKTLAIVTARGGSKGIPGKNIADLAGKPLIAHSLLAIKQAKSVDRVVLTTDDKKIASAGKKYGAEVPFMRPKRLARDNTPSVPVIEHAILWLEKNEGYIPDYVVLVEPTTPLIRPEQIDGVFKLMIKKGADSATTVKPVPRMFHPYHVRYLDKKGFLKFERPKMHFAHPYRQLDPKRYAHGNLWWFGRDIFLKHKKVEVGKLVGLEIDEISAHDINDPIDLEVARYLIKKKK